MSTRVNITDNRHKELERAERKLQALDAGGFDSWEWYGESLKDIWKNKKLD